ncbi:MAG: 2-hydroxyacyl-CoA dehydratase [Desulfarculaceae bacterium]|nr:2-hydroxyacyl-CoA dehydratase [Desulfarculaceae bacterium]MCF8047569.1 2-hydroxyacyl-CoA dehydratase [Desulfarculaceae bacterium]MCF8063844.1 2-hydroxyacyl-CoA dehydratase [Desulfarculaceae bacterium]MCF8099427.1 2-hydroxyacyl-CoA dehydratase [Desulfarculaceae bacterium]MCF8122597.1 2-hydroxyacyl-CoA dehydratase [Desulfarculaceae bacterium]
MSVSRLLGITSTIPVEVALAGGWTPVDLNNRFITHRDPGGLVQQAEDQGLPRTLCAWIKGMYAWCLRHPEVAALVGVTRGDCSNTHALMELLCRQGRRVIPFDYPGQDNPAALHQAMQCLARDLGADLARAEEIRRELIPLRESLERLDRLTWREGKVSGAENHLWLVSASDFDGDPVDFAQRLGRFLAEAGERPTRSPRVRLGLLGVPPIISGLHETLEELGASVVFNEVPRQFAMLAGEQGRTQSLSEQYARYSYPYEVGARVADIRREAERRSLDGLIHYTQSFCWRQMQDLVLRRELNLPLLTLEGDQVAPVDGRTRLRLEAFVEVLG